MDSDTIRFMEEWDILRLESAITAIDEAASAVAEEVERQGFSASSLARLSKVEAELKRSRIELEKIVKEESE